MIQDHKLKLLTDISFQIHKRQILSKPTFKCANSRILEAFNTLHYRYLDYCIKHWGYSSYVHLAFM